ncbi:hypothetical protein L7F22_013878 [Adiantum nelumboides]|nr:hypothetical protein [Adiantum nelumboides]
MFHFQIVHVEGNKNVVVDALSRKPQISAVSIPYHHELKDMREQYANGEDFARIFEQLMDGQRHEHYLLKDGFMMMHGRLCVTRPLRHKVIEASHVPSYTGHRDEQSEGANSIVLDLLKCYVSEHKAKWEQYLPLVEYAYNNTVHLSTDKVPFEIVEGGKKVPPILHTKHKIFEADKYVQDMYKKVKITLEKTQAKQKSAADRHRREVVFSLDDWVLLRFEKTRLKKMKGNKRLLPKLSMRYYGPFQVCDRINDVAYRLKLP